MSGRVGYEYDYRFSMVDANEISSVYKLFPDPDHRTFLFEFRTKFIIRKSAGEGVVADSSSTVIDSERYDICVLEIGSALSIYFPARCRLEDYWMSDDEIKSLSCDAFDFAKQMSAKPEHAYRRLFPIAVDIDVCTVQQEGEAYDACMERAIRPQNMVPLYLWPTFTSVEERKPMTPMLISFLSELPRTRVEDIDKVLGLVEVCGICSKKTKVGDQISVLECAHAFHSHCIVRQLEDSRLCPTCQSPAYESYIDDGPPFPRIRPYVAKPCSRFDSLAL